MPPATPQYTIAKPAGGVLPISVTNTQSEAPKSTPTPRAKPAGSRLKVVVRRLPPGLTEAEFKTALGEEWMLEGGKVDWFRYDAGKVSKDVAKASKPSRAYLRVTEQSHLDTLAEKIRQTPFTDARNTSNDAALLGPPILEFAPYGRVPAGKRRNDARQGLIDQDPEFIEFLESLTNPIVKPNPVDSLTAEGLEKKEETVTVTPLIQHLRDKKAGKEKSASAKATKHGRQSSKAEAAEAKSESKAASKAGKESSDVSEKRSGRASRAEKAAKEPGRNVKKETVTASQKGKAAAAASAENSKPTSEGSAKKTDPSSHASAAARMIQRDLGIRGGRGAASRRGGRATAEQKAAAAAATASSAAESTTSDKDAASTDTTLSSKQDEAGSSSKAPPSEPEVPTGPAASRKQQGATSAAAATNTPPSKPAKKTTSGASSTASQSAAGKAAAAPSPAATQAFLKHANASQGITESLLEEAMAVFGAVSKVEIDKRKGFAYVDFAEPEGLQKAMAASPVKVAQGSVQVLERKDRPAAKASNVSSGRGGGSASGARGGSAFRGGARGGGRRGGGFGRGGADAAVTASTSSANAEGDAVGTKSEAPAPETAPETKADT